jgi:hypothetical protein
MDRPDEPACVRHDYNDLIYKTRRASTTRFSRRSRRRTRRAALPCRHSVGRCVGVSPLAQKGGHPAQRAERKYHQRRPSRRRAGSRAPYLPPTWPSRHGLQIGEGVGISAAVTSSAPRAPFAPIVGSCADAGASGRPRLSKFFLSLEETHAAILQSGLRKGAGILLRARQPLTPVAHVIIEVREDRGADALRLAAQCSLTRAEPAARGDYGLRNAASAPTLRATPFFSLSRGDRLRLVDQRLDERAARRMPP